MCVYLIVQCKLLAFSFQRTRTHPPPCNNVNHASTPSMQTSTNRFREQSNKHSSNQPITESINRTCSASTQSTNAPIRRPDVPVPRYASCVHQDGLFSILTSFEDRWAKRPALCLRFSGRTSGSSSGNDTLFCKLFATKAWSQPGYNVQLRD